MTARTPSKPKGCPQLAAAPLLGTCHLSHWQSRAGSSRILPVSYWFRPHESTPRSVTLTQLITLYPPRFGRSWDSAQARFSSGAKRGKKIVVRKAGRYSSEDIHQALFAKRPPKPRKLDELKEAVRQHIREKHARH